MEKISPPVRILSIVLVLVGVAGMLLLRTMGPSEEIVAVPLPAQKPAVQTAQAGLVGSKAKAAPKASAAKAAPAKPVAKAAASAPPKAVNPPVPATGFPVAVDAALRKNEVVVVSLVVPGARVDELAAAEARAGAKLGGAGFLALNVLNEKVARALLTKLATVEDPSVLVIKRSGEVALKLPGFVDRETVAQAAANAAS